MKENRLLLYKDSDSWYVSIPEGVKYTLKVRPIEKSRPMMHLLGREAASTKIGVRPMEKSRPMMHLLGREAASTKIGMRPIEKSRPIMHLLERGSLNKQ